MKGVLQSIINDVFNGAFVWRYLDLFMLVFVGQSSPTQWFTTACHVFSKLNLEIVLWIVVWHMVIGLMMSGWTWSTLLKHLNVMSLPNCGFNWPVDEGSNWILRVNKIDHVSPFQQRRALPLIRYSIVHWNDFWLWQFRAVQHAASHKAVSKEQEYVLPLSSKSHLKLFWNFTGRLGKRRQNATDRMISKDWSPTCNLKTFMGMVHVWGEAWMRWSLPLSIELPQMPAGLQITANENEQSV